MEYRKFYLQNAEGARIDLNGADAIWARDPVGLGVEISPVTGDLGHGFFKTLQEANRLQGKPGFTLIFSDRDRNYAQYRELMEWIAAAGDGLQLVYCPSGTDEFFRRVLLRTARKTEKNDVGWLEIPVELVTLSPWYLPSSLNFYLGQESDELRFDDGRFDVGLFSETQGEAFSAVINPAGTESASLLISFSGTATGLVLTLTGLNTGKVYGRCAVSYQILSGDVLEYSSLPSDSYCRVIRSGSPVDMANYMDPSSSPWMRVPVTEPCMLTMTATSITGSATATVHYYYSTV